MALRLDEYHEVLRMVAKYEGAKIEQLISYLREFTGDIFLIGNGGSAAIASHTAVDLCEKGKRARALNDVPMLTCLSNDYSYAQSFSIQLSLHGKKGDLLIAISSSGESSNILWAVDAALVSKMKVVILSGFTETNTLRQMGGLINFYVPSVNYGIVEVCHQAILHAVTDGL